MPPPKGNGIAAKWTDRLLAAAVILVGAVVYITKVDAKADQNTRDIKTLKTLAEDTNKSLQRFEVVQAVILSGQEDIRENVEKIEKRIP